MDTDFLATLIAVADEGSVAAAGRKLGLSPGAVSLRLRTIEEEIGVRLFARAGRQMVPTAAGARIMDRARAVVRDVRDLQAAATADGNRLQGEIRLGAIGSAITGLLPPVLVHLTRTQPGLDLFIAPGASIDLYGRVLSGDLDAALLVEPPLALPKRARFSCWRAEPLIVIAPPGMAGRDPIDLLRSEPFIRYDRGNWGGRIVDDYLRRLAVAPHERYELDALDGIVVMVAAGIGVSLVPDWPQPWPGGAAVVRLALPDPAPFRRVGLFTLADNARRPLIDGVELGARDVGVARG